MLSSSSFFTQKRRASASQNFSLQPFFTYRTNLPSKCSKMSSLVDGAYFIRNAAAKTVIDVGTSTEPYPKLAGYEYKFDSIDRQLFNVRTVGASTYIIWHQATGRVFDLEESNPGNGTPIITFPLHWGNNQLWKITSARYVDSGLKLSVSTCCNPRGLTLYDWY